VLPRNEAAVTAILDSKILSDSDAQVRKAALLALAEVPESDRAGKAIYSTLGDKRDDEDRWLNDAASIAACAHDAGFLKAIFAAHPGTAAAHVGAPAEVKRENLIPNPGFEDLDSKGTPKVWKLRHYAGLADHQFVQPGHISDHCLKISSTAGSDTSMFVDVPVEPNTTYTLSGWIKTQDVKGARGALLNVHMTEFKTAPLTGANDWRKVAVTFNSGNLNRLSINCLFGGWGQSTGTAWYDDIELTRGQASAMPGKEGRVAAVVLGQYARRGPVDSVVSMLSLAKGADPVLSTMVVKGLAANWPDNAAPKLSEADVTELHAVMKSLPEAAKDRLLSLAGRWNRRDLFPEQSAAVVAALRADVANGKLDAPKRADAARRLVAAMDEAPTVELLFKQISAKTPPDVQLGILDALGDSHMASVPASLIADWPQMTPTAQKAAVTLMLRRSAWTGALLDGIAAGKVSAREMLPQQWDVLTSNPDPNLANRARNVQKSKGGAPSADRAAIVKKLIHIADDPGNAVNGKMVFEKTCMVCHTLGDKGGKVGPELTGVGLRPKVDILLQILDPNRNVEGTYKQWIVKTKDDVISGRIYSESRTNVEIMDAAGQLHHILRDDILILKPTDKGIMPEGLEALPEKDIADLLEYLSLSKVKR
ncbi:MAG TPA: c-type cytochrome, partial [Humisphaera sp.]|nr:c-type cytochrome [Humisphaera sp.]